MLSVPQSSVGQVVGSSAHAKGLNGNDEAVTVREAEITKFVDGEVLNAARTTSC